MKKFVLPLLFGAVMVVVGHFTALYSAPNVIMTGAMTMLSERGVPLHAFSFAPRPTPQTQSVVRPSPDLAYSACLYDLDAAPRGLRVTMAASEGYSSLSFFDASTNNFVTIRGEGKEASVRLLPQSASAEAGDDIVLSPSAKGIILIRRLTPTQADYDAVAAIAADDQCRVI